MTESILFHVSTFLASTTSEHVLDIDTDAWKSLWQWIEIILNHSSEESLKMDNHPVLATPWELNRIIFEVSKLTSRGEIMCHDILSDGGQLLIALDELDNRSELVPNSYAQVRKLYIVCARLLLLTSTSENQRTEQAVSQEVQQLRTQALDLVAQMHDVPECWTFMMRWPLIILGRIVGNNERCTIVESGLEILWQISSCGDVKRGLEAVQGLRNSHEILNQGNVLVASDNIQTLVFPSTYTIF